MGVCLKNACLTSKQTGTNKMIKLPEPITAYFDPSNSVAQKVAAFNETAIVEDEKQRHHGQPEIGKWMEDVKAKYNFVAEPIEVAHIAEQIAVKAKVSGDFPNSPIELDYRFELANGKIEKLLIG